MKILSLKPTERIRGYLGKSTSMRISLCIACVMLLVFVAVGTRVKAAPSKGIHSRQSTLVSRSRAAVAGTVQSLREVPVPRPMAAVIPCPPPGTADTCISGPGVPLNFQPLGTQIVRNQAALVRLGKALFWDMQVGSDGVQACATCHFSAGADIRIRNQISANLSDANFHANSPGPPPKGSGLGGDALFGNPTVPYTANDPNTPGGSAEPPPARFSVPGFPQFAPNYMVTSDDFPLNGWFRPTLLTPRGRHVTVQEEFANVSRDTNDILASQGVRFTSFVGVIPGVAKEKGDPLADIFNIVTPGVLNKGGRVRRAMPRNSPTVINAVFNFDNLWGGAASFIFNGVNPFGFRDRKSQLQINTASGLTPVFIRITNSSVASVAVGATLNPIAMSFNGRKFQDVGLKLSSLRPLAKQLVSPDDSVLGAFSRAAGGRKGLTFATYEEMVKAAFQPQWWNSPAALTVTSSPALDTVGNDDESGHLSAQVIGEVKAYTSAAASAGPAYTQMDLNFSLFFGLAVQAYQATLISDGTPFDHFMGAAHPVRQPNGASCPPQGCTPEAPKSNALSARQKAGLTIFTDNQTHCADCHVLPITTGHTVLDYEPNAQGVPAPPPREAIEFMTMADGERANYDHGMYNIGLRRSCVSGVDPATCPAHNEDKGRGATANNNPQFQNPLLSATVKITSISRVAGLVTVTTDTPNPFLAPGIFVAVAGVSDSSFNGAFPVGVQSPTQFSYSQPTLPNARSSGGMATAGKPFPISLVELAALRASSACNGAKLRHVGCLPPDVARFVTKTSVLPRRVTNGAFKAPNLRNIKFSGPYFHVGDSATLRQVVEFYTRGGNFPNTNIFDKTVDIDGIPELMFPEFLPDAQARIEALVDFLAEGLTDPRVALEQAPFDHPELIVPNGSPTGAAFKDLVITIPAVGKNGRGATALPTFLGLDPQQP